MEISFIGITEASTAAEFKMVEIADKMLEMAMHKDIKCVYFGEHVFIDDVTSLEIDNCSFRDDRGQLIDLVVSTKNDSAFHIIFYPEKEYIEIDDKTLALVINVRKI